MAGARGGGPRGEEIVQEGAAGAGAPLDELPVPNADKEMWTSELRE
jgi:hypothetical protein